MTAETEPLLDVRGLGVFFRTVAGEVQATRDVTFQLRPGERLGIVGESGCGKSVTARSILRIVERPGRIVGGEILLRRADGSVLDLVKLPSDGAQMRAIRDYLLTFKGGPSPKAGVSKAAN